MSYEEWEKLSGISPLSPEAHYAKLAWNAAINSALEVVDSALKQLLVENQ